MGVRGDNLEINILFAEVFLHGVGVLVVKDVEIGGCTVSFEVFVARRPGCSDI